MGGKIMYCAIPTRLRHLSDQIRNFARCRGYAPTVPFDIGPYEDFEGGSIGRERTIQYMIYVMRFADTVGIFGISEGVMGELRDALDQKKEIRIFPEFDPKWDTLYEVLNPKYDYPFDRLRGPNTLIVLVAASAVGKTFWSDKLIGHYGGLLQRVKNTTTRSPRNEKDYESYNFVTKEEFEKGISEKKFLEHDVDHDNYYGSSFPAIRAVLEKSSGIFALTPAGAKAVYERRFEINLVILHLTASEELLNKNFHRRGIDEREEQEKLLMASKNFELSQEIPHVKICLTGDMQTDLKRFLSVTEPLIKENPV